MILQANVAGQINIKKVLFFFFAEPIPSKRKMEALNALKVSGTKRLQAKKYIDAIQVFTSVIDQLSPSNDDESNLKSVCLLNRSACYIIQNDFAQATKDAEEAIKICQSRRDANHFEKSTPEALKNDILTHTFALANVRLGEINEAQLDNVNAFKYYSIAFKVEPEGEAKKSIRELLKKYNVPEIRTNDKDLEIFAKIRSSIHDEQSLIQNLAALMEQTALQNTIPQAIYNKIDQLKYPFLFYAILQLYNNVEMIVFQCMIILRTFCEHQMKSVWSEFLLIKEVMTKYANNKNIIVECIKFLRNSPNDKYQLFVKHDFLAPIAAALKLDLNEVEAESIFHLLYYIASSPSHVSRVADIGIMKDILQRRTIGALMLLSKLCQDPELLIEASENGANEWVLQMAHDHGCEHSAVMHAACVYYSRLLLNRKDEVNEAKKDEIAQMFDTFAPVVMKNAKSQEVVSSVFAAFALGVRFATEKVKQHKIVNLASVILSIYIKNPAISQNIVTFIYECADNGLVDDIKAVPAAVTTVMRAFTENPSAQTIVERAAAVAFLCDHENKDKLLGAALMQFPESKFLLDFKEKHSQ
ncbi:hypothetical protein TRFO_42652 [Tritrichomonas foetus]|uniref:TPR Domain containing protein n=1 Tax=Tritrichomonas foetus TaxID=1144522 RepID=A0A1J4KVF1_9EUKA|nr:hypothetical protein TRFO_42652 [Tritrichomonas foetus]|eukprot:OHT15215.1 hypothetical protein TRFO_42652 [Tritrichomonas foetus]